MPLGASNRFSLFRFVTITGPVAAICLALAACQQAEIKQSKINAEQSTSNLTPEQYAAASELKAAAADADWMKALPPVLQRELQGCMSRKILAELFQMRAQGLAVTKDDIYFTVTSTFNAVALKDVTAFDSYCPDTIRLAADYPL